jgi:hypothetical protein
MNVSEMGVWVGTIAFAVGTFLFLRVLYIGVINFGKHYH